MVETKEIKNKKEWDEFLNKHPESNFLQSWEWGEFHGNLGHKIIRIGFYEQNKLTGVMLSIVEKARRGTYLTVPAGPIIDWKNKKEIKSFKNIIIQAARENNCSFIRVRPQLVSNDFSKSIFKHLGFRAAPMHLHAELTNQLNISKSEEELLSNMRKATRYEIKKAGKIGIRLEESRKTLDIKKFYNLQITTAKRKKFVPFTYKFLARQFEAFAENGDALLYSAYFGKKLLAQALIIFYGSEAVYHYGASTPEGRKYPGAYLIQWHAILEAKRRNIVRYNFWGVANDPAHRFYNLSMFKRGFGGEDVEYLHAQDFITQKYRYWINYIVESIRKKIRGL